jgi:hypothetical protein
MLKLAQKKSGFTFHPSFRSGFVPDSLLPNLHVGRQPIPYLPQIVRHPETRRQGTN